MGKRINTILNSNKDTFVIWTNVIKKYENELSNKSNHQDIIESKLFGDTFYVFSQLFDLFKEAIKFNEKWSEPTFINQITGINVAFEAKNNECKFLFGLYENEYFLETFLPNPFHLDKVSDEFWENILKLRKYGDLNFQESSSVIKHKGVDVESRYNTESTIFKMIRNFIFLTIEEDKFFDYGMLSIRWPSNIELSALVKKGSNSLNLLYKINRELLLIKE
jgi:hypothetical protein